MHANTSALTTPSHGGPCDDPHYTRGETLAQGASVTCPGESVLDTELESQDPVPVTTPIYCF